MYFISKKGERPSRLALQSSGARGLILVAVVFGLPQFSHASWGSYDVYPVPEVNDHSNVMLGINSYNSVTGYSESANQDLFGMTAGPNGFTVLGLPVGAKSVEFLGLNDDQTSVGSALVGSNLQAITYRSGQGIEQIFAPSSTLPGSQGIAINQAGTMIGTLYVEKPDGRHYSMFSYDTNLKQITGLYPDTLPGAISDDGLIAATNAPGTNPSLDGLYIYDGQNASQYKLPSYALSIDPTGISTATGPYVVGAMSEKKTNATGSNVYGFLFAQFSQFWYPMPDPLGKNYETWPEAVDYWGEKAVGFYVDAKGVQTATAWTNPQNHMTWQASTLADALGNPAGWTFNFASGINSLGAVTGRGVYNGKACSFIAIPHEMFQFALGPLSIVGGNMGQGKVNLPQYSAQNLIATGLSTSPSAQPASRIRIPKLVHQTSFDIDTTGVDRATATTISVTLGGVTRSARLSILPATEDGMAVFPSRVGPDQRATGTVELNGQTGPSGITLQLTSNDDAVTVPTSVFIGPGLSKITFPISVGAVRKAHTATIYAAQGDIQLKASIQIG